MKHKRQSLLLYPKAFQPLFEFLHMHMPSHDLEQTRQSFLDSTENLAEANGLSPTDTIAAINAVVDAVKTERGAGENV